MEMPRFKQFCLNLVPEEVVTWEKNNPSIKLSQWVRSEIYKENRRVEPYEQRLLKFASVYSKIDDPNALQASLELWAKGVSADYGVPMDARKLRVILRAMQETPSLSNPTPEAKQ